MLKSSSFHRSSWNRRSLLWPTWAVDPQSERVSRDPRRAYRAKLLNPQVGTTIPSDPCRRWVTATMRLRCVESSGCAVPANSCGHPAAAEHCAPWRRLIPRSCRSCLSFITGGFFPTPSTIAGSTMAEVMEAGSGMSSRSGGEYEEGTLAWQYEVPSARQPLGRAPSLIISSLPPHLWGINGPREDIMTRPHIERQSRCSYHYVVGHVWCLVYLTGRRMKLQRRDLHQGPKGISGRERGT